MSNLIFGEDSTVMPSRPDWCRENYTAGGGVDCSVFCKDHKKYHSPIKPLSGSEEDSSHYNWEH